MEHLSRNFSVSLSLAVLLFGTKISSTIMLLPFLMTTAGKICIARNACINTHY